MTERSESNGNIDKSGSKPLAVKWALMMSVYKNWIEGKLIVVVLHLVGTTRKILV